MTTPHENPAFVGDDGRGVTSKNNVEVGHITSTDTVIGAKNKPMPERDTWGKGIEFLLSCIAMSVGLGNVWRFPFTALDNGGGAFLIPYLVVLFLVGKPIYYLEMIIGQFSSRGSVKVFDLCPAMRGVGIGQIVSISMVTTYYVAIMGMTVRYLFDSFKSPLPWTECRESWNAVCVASAEVNTAEILYSASDNLTSTTLPSIISNVSSVILNNVTSLSSVKPKSSAELYFICKPSYTKNNSELEIVRLSEVLIRLPIFVVRFVCIVLLKNSVPSTKSSAFLSVGVESRQLLPHSGRQKGGQFILTLVDYFGASMIALVLGIAELYCLGWVYGVDRLCKDAEFMMGRKVGPYWRWCWAVVTPLIMTVILIYFLSTYTPLTYNGVNYPNWAYAIGWTITCFGVLQLPIWVVVAAIRTPGATWGEKLRGAFKPKHDWGPTDPLLREQYNKEIANEAIANEGLGCWGSIKKNIFG
ncbi:sodium-dependent nutrient amino acid transporter 1 [Lucilia cuprina]|uniref:sodium-dependent nutrient amino acid transporter 1 n=1 Tax=Lucilia cuprina TaxID=7375 RepID=UPI001F054A19|nr:sodium-dependent nutrient amino acid transporter 1 [Lucilia cuprina]